jgi:mycothione reductase
MPVKRYDLIVIGSGAGMNVAARAVAQGMKVAIIDSGPLGGTCLNRGCVPSKVMLYPATLIRMAQEAQSIGVSLTLEKVDYPRIMQRVWQIVLDERTEMERAVEHTDGIPFFHAVGSFVSDYVMRVGRDRLTAKTILIAAGSRPAIPPAPGLEETGYLTSDTIFDLKEPPKSLIIVGGGYVGAEFAHFFSAIGVEVTLVGRNPRLLPDEEPLISTVFHKKMSAYCRVHAHCEIVSARRVDGQKVVVGRQREDDRLVEFKADEILIAAGRRPNADLLKPEKTGVDTDEAGWIIVDPYLHTSKEGIWALGDATGKHMFRHTANYESDLMWMNAFGDHKHPVDEHAVPHAVFAYPEVASVGLTEEQARLQYNVLAGISRYYDTTKGFAMGEEDGLVKVIVEEETGKILGAHAVGPEASLLVQPLVYLMNAENQDYMPLARAQTIHPALSEVVIDAFGNLQPVGEHHHDHAHDHGHERDHDHESDRDH